MYRRQEGKLSGDILGRLYCEYRCGNCIGVLGSKFYVISVVGRVVNCTGVIYGVRTSLFLTSQRMPSRYGGVHEHLKLYKRNNYIYVNVIIYVYIRTHRWLYVVITTKVRIFLVRYFINAALLVIIHIPRTQKWAAGHTVPAVTDAIARL